MRLKLERFPRNFLSPRVLFINKEVRSVGKETNYTYELEYLIRVIKALEFVVSRLEALPVSYPMFIRDVNTLLYGRITMVKGEKILVNGILQQIDEMYDTMESLELEVQFELGGDEDEEEVQA